jgi:hypothetical protein
MYDMLTAEEWSPLLRWKEELLTNIEGSGESQDGYYPDGKMTPEIFVKVL